MKLSRQGRWGALAAGIMLLIWGTTSAFSDWKQLAALQPDVLDNPDSGGSQWILPTDPIPAVSQSAISGNPSPTPFQPGLGSAASVNPGAASASSQADQLSNLPTSVPGGDSQIFSVPYSNTPVKSPEPIGLVPERIVIPAIDLDAPIEKVPYRLVKDDATGMVLQQWSVPNKFAVGWQGDSAMLGVKGNTVLDGHHNEYGKVFRYLINLSPGQLVEIYSGNTLFKYQITNKMLLLERNQPLSVRFENARWLLPSGDERITLVTCWPYTSNTHRLIIVAVPVGKTQIGDSESGTMR